MILFHTRLNYIMSAIGLKNSELAKHMFVDPSLVSRWRAGKRKPDVALVRKIASAIIALCKSTANRLLLCNAIDLTYRAELFCQERHMLEQALCIWLDQVDQVDQGDASDGSAWQAESPTYLPQAERVELHEGDDGNRYCLYTLLSLAVEQGTPFTLTFYSDCSIAWLVDSEPYWTQFQKLLQRATYVGITIKLVYHISSNSKRVRHFVKLWDRLQRIENAALYIKGVRDNPSRQFKHLLVSIPGVGAISGWVVRNSSIQHACLLTSERASQHVEGDCQYLLSSCIPMSQKQDQFNYAKLLDFFGRFTGAYRDALSHSSALPLGAMPLPALKEMLENALVEPSEIARVLTLHKQHQQSFRQFLLNSRIDYYHCARGKAEKTLLLPYANTLFGHPLSYTDKLYKQHLLSVIDLLRQCPQFHFFSIAEPLYSVDVTIGVGAYLLTFDPENINPVSFSSHQRFANDVCNYIVFKAQPLMFSRSATIAHLQALCASL